MSEPHTHDVLFGKVKGSYGHRGNVVFRELVSMNKVIIIAHFQYCLFSKPLVLISDQIFIKQ